MSIGYLPGAIARGLMTGFLTALGYVVLLGLSAYGAIGHGPIATFVFVGSMIAAPLLKIAIVSHVRRRAEAAWHEFDAIRKDGADQALIDMRYDAYDRYFRRLCAIDEFPLFLSMIIMTIVMSIAL